MSYPELRLKRLRARLSLVLFIFSAVIFGSMPFYRPDQPSDQQFHPLALISWFLPLAFLVVFIKASMSLRYLRTRAAAVGSARQKDLEAEIFLSNFNARRGRAFNYRLALPGMPMQEGIVESSEFVANLGYSEQGGEVLEASEGRQIFAHKLVVKPLYRKLKMKLRGLYRPGANRPFLVLGEGVRIWLKDEPSS